MKQSEKNTLWAIIIVLVLVVIFLWTSVRELENNSLDVESNQGAIYNLEDKVEKLEYEVKRLDSEKLDTFDFEERFDDAIDYYL